MVDNMSKRGFAPLHYRFEDRKPGGGELTEVADGVFWLRLPMFGRLNHINVWLLRDHDGWTVVDTGLNRDDVQRIWRAVFEKHLDGKPVTRVIATHLHGDHTGNAGWICAHWGCELWMSRADFYMCKVMAADGPSDVPEDALRFYRRAGSTKRGSIATGNGSVSSGPTSPRYRQDSAGSRTASTSTSAAASGGR